MRHFWIDSESLIENIATRGKWCPPMNAILDLVEYAFNVEDVDVIGNHLFLDKVDNNVYILFHVIFNRYKDNEFSDTYRFHIDELNILKEKKELPRYSKDELENILKNVLEDLKRFIKRVKITHICKEEL